MKFFLKVFFRFLINHNKHYFNELFRCQRCRFKRLQTYNLISICKGFIWKLLLFFFKMWMNAFPCPRCLGHLVCGVQIYNAFYFNGKLFGAFFCLFFSKLEMNVLERRIYLWTSPLRCMVRMLPPGQPCLEARAWSNPLQNSVFRRGGWCFFWNAAHKCSGPLYIV